MSRGLTRKHDFEKGKRQQNAQKQDYRDRFNDEGANFDRGGKVEPQLLSIHKNSVVLDRRPLWTADKQSLIRTLETGCKFTVGDKAGTISQLRRIPGLEDVIDDGFELMCRSIMRITEFVEIVKHPKKNRNYYLAEFRCPFKPANLTHEIFFKDTIAFRMKLVGPALSGC